MYFIYPFSPETYTEDLEGSCKLIASDLYRLHDLRSHKTFEREYIDIMDSNPIYCIQPMNDRFLVGSGSEAVVNIFDLRMHKAYNHYEARPPPLTNHHHKTKAPRNEFSFFLSHHPPNASRNHRSYGAYRGPIYNMSSPSSTSATVYTGIVDGVVRLDFASTDDLLSSSSSSDWYQDYLDLKNNNIRSGMTEQLAPAQRTTNKKDRVLELSGYERPSPENKSASAKLRSQVPFWELSETDERRELESGWDRRWKRLDENQSWRSRGV